MGEPQRDFRVVDGGRAGELEPEPRCYDLELEANVVGNAVAQPDLLSDLEHIVKPEHMHSESHRRVYESTLRLAAQGRPVDIVSVGSELREKGRLQQVSRGTLVGIAALTELVATAPVLLRRHVLDHGRRVRELWVRREYRDLGRLMTAEAEHAPAEVTDLVAKARARLDTLAGILGDAEAGHRADAVAARMLANLEKQGQKAAGGVARAWGYRAVDGLTAGLHNELAIVGARPGMGKTGFACGVAEGNAQRGIGAFIASLETERDALLLRMTCARAGVDVHRARVGAIDAAEWSRFTAAAAEIAKLPLWIDDTPAIPVAELWARARRVQLALEREQKSLGVVVVDYVQLLRAPRPGMKREEVVAENVRALKAMAQELGVTVIGLAQLNREVDKRSDRRPKLSDLRESGEIEQCARTVLLLFRADYYAAKRRDFKPTGIVEVNIAKQNNGPAGVVRLAFDAPTTRFSDVPEGTVTHAGGGTYVCGGCGSRVSAGVSCACGATTTPAADPDEGERDEAIDEWLARQPGEST